MFESLLMGNKGKVSTIDNGFLGEVSSADFITGVVLASAMDFTDGGLLEDHGWLKYVDEGKIKFLAKRPFRYNTSWTSLQYKDLLSGNRTIDINGQLYRVRVPQGRGDDSNVDYADNYDGVVTHGSEWNRLMYHVSGKPFADPSTTLASEGIAEGDWAQYAESDLITHLSNGYGSLTICQELTATGNAVFRGYYGVSFYHNGGAAYVGLNRGWRPLLELVD